MAFERCSSATDDCSASGSHVDRLISEVRRDGGTVTLSLRGALDASSIGELRPTVEALRSFHDQTLVIDLGGLRLLDTTGVREVLQVVRAVTARGGTTVVQGAHEQPLSILKLLRLDGMLAPAAG